MAFNATLPPTVAEFRAVFPEFAAASDAQVEFYLFTGMQWVDTYWAPIDAKLAVMYAAAHFLWVQSQASGGTSLDTGGSGSSGSGGGAQTDPEVGKIWARTVRFRDRMVTFERVNANDNQSGSSGGGSDASQFWEATAYGQMYLSFLRRNVPHVAVI
jgi:hypothetical protein